MASVERMLHPIRPAALWEHHQRRDEEDPHDAHRERREYRGEGGKCDVERADGNTGNAGALFVDDDGCEGAMRKPYRREPEGTEKARSSESRFGSR